jgi:hypothetical protein
MSHNRKQSQTNENLSNVLDLDLESDDIATRDFEQTSELSSTNTEEMEEPLVKKVDQRTLTRSTDKPKGGENTSEKKNNVKEKTKDAPKASKKRGAILNSEESPKKIRRAENWDLDDDLAFLRLIIKHHMNYTLVREDMMNNQHRKSECSEQTMVKHYNNIKGRQSKYWQEYKRKKFNPKKKDARGRKKTETVLEAEAAVHEENETYIENTHFQIQEILKKLKKDEVVCSTMKKETLEAFTENMNEKTAERKLVREEMI